jgi:hypothetical protein
LFDPGGELAFCGPGGRCRHPVVVWLVPFEVNVRKNEFLPFLPFLPFWDASTATPSLQLPERSPQIVRTVSLLYRKPRA